MTTIEGFPLSPQQERLWKLGRAGGAPTGYTSRCALELRGDLDVERLRRALEEVVARHEILRTSFPVPPSLTTPLQVIAEEGAVDWRAEERTGEPAGAPFGRSGNVPTDLPTDIPTDIARGPLLSALLVRSGEERHGLILRLPALCADLRSLVHLADELARAYAGEVLAPVSMQYADYAAWLNEQLVDEAAAAGRAFWRGRDLAGLAELRLPLERETTADFAPALEAADWPAARWGEIEAAALAAGVRSATWLLAAWQALLERLVGRSPVAIGVLCDGREFEEVATAVGPYARYVPLATGASGAGAPASRWGRPLADTAVELEASLAEARQWQDFFSWEDGAGEASGATAFCPFCFELAELPPVRRAADMELRVTYLSARLDRFKVGLGCLVSADGLRVELAYDPGRFEATTAARLGEQLRVLVEGALLAPAVPRGELPLLSPAARHQLLSVFNLPVSSAPSAESGDESGACELFFRQVARYPQRVALEEGARTLTYAGLAERSRTLARRLRALGVGPEVVVGLFLERSPEMVLAVLAVLAAGGAYLPLDPGLPAERLAFMLEDSAAALVLTAGAVAAALPPGAPPSLRMDEEASPPTAPVPPVLPEFAPPLPEQLAYVIYTSGSTGRPKGTLLSHRALANYLAWSVGAYVSAGADGSPLHSPLAFDLTVTSLFAPLLAGQRVTLVPESRGLDGLVAELRRDREPSFVKLTPAHMEVLRQQLGEGVAGVRCRALVLGGEALFAAHVSWWLERAPATRIFNEYGPTEATVGCCVYELPPDALTQSAGALPIGRPIGGMRLHVVDERFELVPPGVSGELLIGGVGLARGYLGRPALTAERFVPDPHGKSAGERLYRTGDLARYLPDGNLEFVGRRDHQVKLHGYRIELGEIEAVLRRHPGVREAVVLLEEEPGGTPRLYACWSGAQPGPGAGELEAWLERQLPDYMVPRLYVGIEALPLTPNGKVDRRALHELARGRAAGQRHPYREPRSRAERLLAEIWTELLPVERVGLDDSFFQLGGDSIVSLQVLGRASRHGLRLTTRQIFDHPTLVELAAVAEPVAAEGAGGGAAGAAEQGLVTGPVPLTPIQHAFFATPDPTPEHYDLALYLNLGSALRLPLGEARLAGAVDALWRHHDALRLRFHKAGGTWTQENAGLSGAGPFAVLDLSALPAEARQTALATAAARLAAGFDLASGPLARFVLLRLDPADRRLLLLLHHLVSDAVSVRILLEDLETACGETASGEPGGLPPKTTSFRRWAGRLAEHADSGALRAELDYWLAPRRLAAVPLPREAPGGGDAFDAFDAFDAEDGVRGGTVATSAIWRQELDPAATLALLQEVPRAYRTEIGDVLLAALALTLGGWCGGPVLVDLEGHGREDLFADLDPTRTVGWFTTVYPVLLDPPAGVETRDLSRQLLIGVKEELRRLPGRGLGYGLLRYLGSDRAVREALAAMPAAEVSFNYLGQLGRSAAAARAGAADPLFAPAGELGAPPQGPLRRRPYCLEINAFIASGALGVEWRYDRATHRRETIETLGRSFLGSLRELIAHCRSRQGSGSTPADFPLARLDLARLDELTAIYGEIADLYPLAPIQESMLLHTLSFPDSDVGFEQTPLRFGGEVDRGALRDAFRRLAERHPVLRTGFAWQGRETALQVVLPRAEAPWAEVDFSALPPARREASYRELLAADRRRGFDLSRVPLQRLTLVRFRVGQGEEAGEHRLVWSRHHVLLDGWSTAILLGELEILYRALRHGGDPAGPAEPELPRCWPYRDYIAWLQGQDPARTAEYWRRLLAGLSAPTPLALERSGPPLPSAGWTGRRRTLPTELGAGLRGLTGRHGLTASLLLQAAWACLLSRYSGEPDVLFGSTVAGRPADLAGVETMVGLFIKNLPVRIHCGSQRPVLGLLRDLQREQIELREHEAASPADVQAWSEVPGHLPLFESLVVFENYPLASPALVTWNGDDAAAEEESAAAVRTAYPLTLVGAQADRLVLLLVADGERFEDTAVRRMLGHLENLLAGMASGPERPVSALPLLAASERHQLAYEWGWDRSEQPWQVRDSEGRRVPAGVAGELCRCPPGGPPEATGEVAFHRADGEIVSLGRQDRLLWVQGRRVDPRQVEAVLAEHPALAGVAALVHGGSLWVYVEPAPHAPGAAPRAPDAGELRAFLRARWPGAPQPEEIVFLPSLPRRANGAVDPAALPSPGTARLAAEISRELLGAERDLLEAQLARLWEDVLGTRPIGPDDDFFSLGGTSVAALRLTSRLRRDLGHDLPLAVLYEAVTVRGLAAYLRSATDAARGSGTSNGSEIAWSSLVPIRPDGERRPFFCVHPVGGNVLCFLDLARRFPAERPFYGLQSAGLGGSGRPYDRLADMAASYLDEIRRVQPVGPYLLGGLSFGGYVAFEMAQQLHERGEEVALLALLDTASPLYRGERTFRADAATVLALQAGFITRAGGAPALDLDAGELRGLGRGAQLDAVVERLLGALGRGGLGRDLGAESLRRVLALYQAHALCLESYRPRPYPGRITVFRAREGHATLEAMLDHPAQHEPDYGWGELAAEPVDVRRVSGDHSTLIYEPQVVSLAAELSAALAVADPAGPFAATPALLSGVGGSTARG